MMKSLFLCVQLLFVIPTVAVAQDTYMSLKQEKVGYTPKDFFVSSVVDDRSSPEAVGTVNGARLLMKGGAAAAINTFVAANVTQNANNHPVSMHISVLDINIGRVGTTWQVSAKVSFGFYVGDDKVIEYSGEAKGKTEKDPVAYVEQFVRKNIESDLQKFEAWWMQNKGGLVLERSVKVNVTIGKTLDKPNTIVYSLARQLVISDFKGVPAGQGEELAETVSGVYISYSGEVVNSQTIIDITITPYFEVSRSWMKEGGRNPYILGHEQAHFDITAIKACELAQQLRSTIFTVDNYERQIKELQQQNTKESNEEEAMYDAATNHGILTDKQAEWQKRITQRAKSVGCF